MGSLPTVKREDQIERRHPSLGRKTGRTKSLVVQSTDVHCCLQRANVSDPRAVAGRRLRDARRERQLFPCRRRCRTRRRCPQCIRSSHGDLKRDVLRHPLPSVRTLHAKATRLALIIDSVPLTKVIANFAFHLGIDRASRAPDDGVLAHRMCLPRQALPFGGPDQSDDSAWPLGSSPVIVTRLEHEEKGRRNISRIACRRRRKARHWRLLDRGQLTCAKRRT